MVGAANTFVSNAIKIGSILVQVKEGLNHGEFKPWIESNLNIGYRTAIRYVKIFQNRDSIEKEGFSSIRQALQFLSEPEADETEPDQPLSELRRKLRVAFDQGNDSILSAKEKAQLRKDLLVREKTILTRREKLNGSLTVLKKQLNFVS
jgi:hypothetical protein